MHHRSAEAAYAQIVPPRPDGLAGREAAWRDVLDSWTCSSFVAEVDGEIVGVLNVGPSRTEPDIGEVYVIYVLPGWWGTEAGQRLIECAHERLARDYAEAVLTVLADNPRARRFYERNGWVLDELRVEPHFAKCGTWWGRTGGRGSELVLCALEVDGRVERALGAVA